MNYLMETHTQKKRPKLLFLHACDMNKARQTTGTHLDWYGFKLAIGTTLAWDPPGVFGTLGTALAFPNWLEGAWYLGAAGPSKNHNRAERISALHTKIMLKPTQGAELSHQATGSQPGKVPGNTWAPCAMWEPQRGLKFVASFLLLVTSVF